VDGSARVQTVSRDFNQRFYELLTAFGKLTGCPILLNTSFNVKGEPIVCSPEDALSCFIVADIDCLVLEDFIIDREENDLELLRVLLSNFNDKVSARKNDLYTFV
jgi:carbamoyltransferase